MISSFRTEIHPACSGGRIAAYLRYIWQQPALVSSRCLGKATTLHDDSRRRRLLMECKDSSARAKTELLIPDDIDAMVATGRRALFESLPERYRAMEHPNLRCPPKEIVFEGVFGRSVPGCLDLDMAMPACYGPMTPYSEKETLVRLAFRSRANPCILPYVFLISVLPVRAQPCWSAAPVTPDRTFKFS